MPNLNPIGSTILTLVMLLSFACQSRHGEWDLVHSSDLAHSAAIETILFVENDEGWALTWADLYSVRDQGKTFIPVLNNSNGERGYYSFTFTTPTTGIVVGTKRRNSHHSVLILKTSDKGRTWKEGIIDVPEESNKMQAPALYDVSFCDEMNGWAVGNALIARTSDGGQNWKAQHSNVLGQRLFSVACVSRERAFAVGTGGLLLRTIDGGETWTHQKSGTTDSLMKIRFYGETGWLVGGTNGKAALFKTVDGGERWQALTVTVRVGLFDVFAVANRVWIAGEKGTVLVSDNGGQTWSSQTIPTKEDVTCLFFLSSNQGWAGGDRHTLLRFSRE